jgi:nitrogen fixation NifU-like protein
MGGDLDELYQSIILDHNRRPQNFRQMADATGHAEGVNPMCGDQLTVWLRLDGDRIADVSFQGSGCAISKASASLMTQAVKGKTKTEAGKIFESFHGLVTGHATGEDLGKLKAFSGVSRFPLRVKCATLAWHALRSALDESAAGQAKAAVE